MRCDQCKHWNRKDARENPGHEIGLGLCEQAIPFWDASEWNEADDFKRCLKAEYIGRKFFAQDGSDYRADVLTAPDFFCAEFDAKP